MSIAATAVAQMPIADNAPANSTSKAPPGRTASAQPDVVQQPDAR
jgi:hypothetical protein